MKSKCGIAFVDMYVGAVVPNVEWWMSGAMYNPGFCAQLASYITKHHYTAYLTAQVWSQGDGRVRMRQSVNNFAGRSLVKPGVVVSSSLG